MNSGRTAGASLVAFDPEETSGYYDEYYSNQIGNGDDFGFGVYRGRRVLRGGGIGKVFSGLFKRILPSLKAGAINLGKRALDGAAGLTSDLVDGQNFKSAAKKRLKSTGKSLLADVRSALASGSRKRGAQSGGGIGRRTPKRRKKSARKTKKNTTGSRRRRKRSSTLSVSASPLFAKRMPGRSIFR
jgi:hypothetical protein